MECGVTICFMSTPATDYWLPDEVIEWCIEDSRIPSGKELYLYNFESVVK